MTVRMAGVAVRMQAGGVAAVVRTWAAVAEGERTLLHLRPMFQLLRHSIIPRRLSTSLRRLSTWLRRPSTSAHHRGAQRGNRSLIAPHRLLRRT